MSKEITIDADILQQLIKQATTKETKKRRDINANIWL